MENIQMIPVECIWEHPENPRKDLGDLTELAASIKENGILQNLTVVKKYGEITKKWFPDNPAYTVVIGHRRLAAAKLAGLKEVPCAVVEMTDKEQFRTMVIENMQRADLTTIEQADSFQMMLDLGDTKEEIAEKTGFSKTTIERRLKLTKLDRKKLIEADNRGGTLFDYMELYKIDDKDTRDSLLESIGTPEFKNNLQRELNKQEREKNKKRIIPIIEEFAKPFPKNKESERWGNKYQRIAQYSFSSDEEIKPPKDKNKTYLYYDSGYDVTIYAPAEKAKKESKPKIVAEYEEWYKGKTSTIREADERHKELRTEFWKNLSETTLQKRNYKDTVIEFFAKICSGYCEGVSLSSLYSCNTFIRKSYGIEKESYQCTNEEKKDILANLASEPMKLLLTEIMAILEEDYGEDYRARTVQYKHSEKYPLYRFYAADTGYNKKHELLIDFLESIGYEAPQEEKDMISGKYFEHINDDAPVLPGLKKGSES